MADDIFTQETLDKLNASALTFNEVVTSRDGGVSTGAIINQTLTPLGETTVIPACWKITHYLALPVVALSCCAWGKDRMRFVS